MNDQNFVLSVLSLEELGATGNKGLAGITGNPVIANGIAGLATSATAQATVERFLLWQLRNETIEPFGETAQQVCLLLQLLQACLVLLCKCCFAAVAVVALTAVARRKEITLCLHGLRRSVLLVAVCSAAIGLTVPLDCSLL